MTVESVSVSVTDVPKIKDMERLLIIKALQVTGYHKRETAKILGISVKTLYTKMHRYKIPGIRTR